MAVRVQGDAAELRWGHYKAATLGAWAIADQALTARLTQVDAFRITQRPLELVVRGQRWAVEQLEVIDDRVTGWVQSRR
jgi:hypothetical protein